LIAKGVVDWFAKDGGHSYTILWDHISKAMTAHTAWLNLQDTVVGPPDHEMLAAKFVSLSIHKTTSANDDGRHTFQHTTGRTALAHTINYSAYSIDRNLILKQTHSFSSAKLTSNQVLATDLRICPHLTTTQFRAFTREPGCLTLSPFPIWRKARLNSPMLSFAINNAFPTSRQIPWQNMEHNFRPTYVREDSQMFMTRKPGEYWWCRSCATKFRVCYAANREHLDGKGSEELTMEVWHNFGSYSGKAMENFGYLVKGSKNDEMKSLSRTFFDFKT
jgi:hypothetical protein